ncbi:hypothetical protein P280DRAFT_390146, partial [Massarina eburnea CBS 473.64]
KPCELTPRSTEVAETLTHLKLSTKSPQKPLAKPKSAPVAESWDEEISDGSATETEDNSGLRSSSTERDSLSPISTTSSNPVPAAADVPCPPPPTPASPQAFDYPDNSPYSIAAVGGAAPVNGGAREGAGGLDRRPEKTTAVAGRLIAGALGVRAPKRTEEEREFDRVTREKERRRRGEEKEREKREKEAAEERKRSVWED